VQKSAEKCTSFPKSKREKRGRCKVARLPAWVRKEAERMLLDPNNTYKDISRHLKERGYEISRWAVAR
jgi:hypothetical protein